MRLFLCESGSIITQLCMWFFTGLCVGVCTFQTCPCPGSGHASSRTET